MRQRNMLQHAIGQPAIQAVPLRSVRQWCRPIVIAAIVLCLRSCTVKGATRIVVVQLRCPAMSGGCCAGSHGFNGEKSSTLFLAPGQHAIEVEYVQARRRRAAVQTCLCPHKGGSRFGSGGMTRARPETARMILFSAQQALHDSCMHCPPAGQRSISRGLKLVCCTEKRPRRHRPQDRDYGRLRGGRALVVVHPRAAHRAAAARSQPTASSQAAATALA